jgi:hypothetical protein
MNSFLFRFIVALNPALPSWKMLLYTEFVYNSGISIALIVIRGGLCLMNFKGFGVKSIMAYTL